MKIYYLNKTDNKQIYDLWYDIFKDSISFCNYYFKEKLLDNQVLVLEKNKKILSMLHLNPYKILLYGSEIYVEYIVGVSTKNNFRGKGYSKSLMTKSINDMYQHGTELTFLTTVDENIYYRYDFRYISSCFNTELIKLKLEPILAVTPVELTPFLFDEFIAYYNQKMKQKFDCYIIRDNYYMERILKELKCENGFIKLFYKNNIIKGYIMLYIYESNIQIRELEFDIEVLGDIISYIQNIMENDKIIHLIHSSYLEYIFQYYFYCKSDIKPYVMARFVCIQKFLERIKSKAPVSINISIIDSVIEENNKTFNWTLSENISYLNETKSKEDIVINIGILTQWILGYISIDELISLNQIEIKNINNVNLIEDLKLINVCNSVFINEVV